MGVRAGGAGCRGEVGADRLQIRGSSVEDDGGEVARGSSGVLVALGHAHNQGPLDEQMKFLRGVFWAAMAHGFELANEELAKALPERFGFRMRRMMGIRK